MPFMDAKTEAQMHKVALLLTALILIFGSVPFLNIGVSTPLIAGITVGTLLGVLILYSVIKTFRV